MISGQELLGFQSTERLFFVTLFQPHHSNVVEFMNADVDLSLLAPKVDAGFEIHLDWVAPVAEIDPERTGIVDESLDDRSVPNETGDTDIRTSAVC